MSEDRIIQLAPNHKVGLALRNPVMPAAGCFGFGTEYAHLVDVEALGAIVQAFAQDQGAGILV